MGRNYWKCQCCGQVSSDDIYCKNCHCPASASALDIESWKNDRRHNPKIPPTPSEFFNSGPVESADQETATCPNCNSEMFYIDSRCPHCLHELNQAEKEELYRSHELQKRRLVVYGVSVFLIILIMAGAFELIARMWAG